VARRDPLFFFGLFFLATPACLSSSLWPLLSVSHPLCPYPPPSVDQTAAPPTSMADSGRLPPTIPNPNSTSLLLSDLHAPPSSLPPNQSGRWGHMGSHGHTDYLDFLEKIISAAYWKKKQKNKTQRSPWPKAHGQSGRRKPSPRAAEHHQYGKRGMAERKMAELGPGTACCGWNHCGRRLAAGAIDGFISVYDSNVSPSSKWQVCFPPSSPP
jgi:hypothetical protein